MLSNKNLLLSINILNPSTNTYNFEIFNIIDHKYRHILLIHIYITTV